jgi:hypothetical protein
MLVFEKWSELDRCPNAGGIYAECGHKAGLISGRAVPRNRSDFKLFRSIAHNCIHSFIFLIIMATSAIVRLVGLAYTVAQKDIVSLFNGFELVQVIIVGRRAMARHSGIGYVQFANTAMASLAITRLDRATLHGRYVEIYPSDPDHLQKALNHNAAIAAQKALRTTVAPIVAPIAPTRAAPAVPHSVPRDVGREPPIFMQAYLRPAVVVEGIATEHRVLLASVPGNTGVAIIWKTFLDRELFPCGIMVTCMVNSFFVNHQEVIVYFANAASAARAEQMKVRFV